jgi:hypothetical protein
MVITLKNVMIIIEIKKICIIIIFYNNMYLKKV